MKQNSRILLALAAFCLPWVLSPPCSPQPSYAGTGAAARHTEAEAAQRISLRERRVELEKRLLLRTLDDLRGLTSLAAKGIADLERETDAIMPLEAAVRETDLRDLIDWYSEFSDWLQEQQAEFDAEMAQFSSGQTQSKIRWPELYGGMADAFKGIGKQGMALAERFDGEGKRLAEIIDRRRLLQGSIADLEERLSRIETRLAERSRKREQEERDAAALRSRISVVQTELLTLPLVNEDILKHYMNLGERARGEGEWLQVKSDEYELLRDISSSITSDRVGSGTAVDAALKRVRRGYQRQIDRMQRRIEAIDRKRSRVAPAGSLREVERSAELNDLYYGQKQRYEDYINRLRIQLGALEAELSGLLER